MKLEQHVVSLALARKLKGLGVKQESLYYWANTVGQKDETCWRVEAPIEDAMLEYISAFTVAELGEILRQRDVRFGYSHMASLWVARLHGPEGEPKHEECAESEANARAQMLIYMLANKLITLP